MDYQGPDPADLANVYALNTAFLDWLVAGRMKAEMPPEAHALLSRMDRSRLDRLARAPFLLLSLCEYDDALWGRLFSDQHGMSLLAAMQPADEDGMRLTTAALGFLWQLAMRNPYAARLVSGASLNWCEQLAACTLMDVVARVAEEPVFLEPR